jgi:hypothetical protein
VEDSHVLLFFALRELGPCQSFRLLALLYHLKQDRSAPDQSV